MLAITVSDTVDYIISGFFFFFPLIQLTLSSAFSGSAASTW